MLATRTGTRPNFQPVEVTLLVEDIDELSLLNALRERLIPAELEGLSHQLTLTHNTAVFIVRLLDSIGDALRPDFNALGLDSELPNIYTED